VLSLHHSDAVSLPVLIERMTAAPARFLNMGIGTLKTGCGADVTIFDPDIEWTVDASEMSTLGKNTPLAGTSLKGRVTTTIFGGTVIWDATAVVPIG
jgi:dihydroorotase